MIAAIIRMIMKSLTFTEGLLPGQEVWKCLCIYYPIKDLSQIPSLIPCHRIDVRTDSLFNIWKILL